MHDGRSTGDGRTYSGEVHRVKDDRVKDDPASGAADVVPLRATTIAAFLERGAEALWPQGKLVEPSAR